MSPALAGGFLITEPPGKAPTITQYILKQFQSERKEYLSEQDVKPRFKKRKN